MATAILTGTITSGDFVPDTAPSCSAVFGDALYYYYDSLPIGFQVVVLEGITYYVFNGVYYQAYIYGGQTVYLVVPAPV